MKKIYFLLSLTCFSLGLNAQITCSPDPIVVLLGIPGIYPNQATGGMGDGTINVAYTQTFTAIVPNDTTISTPAGTLTLAIDAMEVVAVDGLPAGLTYSCDAAACAWGGGTNGCFKVTGTPTVGGDFTVDVQTTITVTVPVIGPFTTPAFPASVSLHIEDPNSVENLQNGGFQLSNNAPNPFSGITSIPFVSAKPGTYNFTVADMNGRTLSTREVNAVAGRNNLEFNANGLSSGIYHYRFEQNGAFATGKMMVIE